MAQLQPFPNPRTALLSPTCTLTPSCRLLLLALLEYVAPRTCVPFPTQQQLSQDTGLGIRSIRSLMEEAVRAGWVERCENRDYFMIVVPSQIAALPAPATAISAVSGNGAAMTKGQERRLKNAAYVHAADRVVGPYYRDTVCENPGAFVWTPGRRQMVVARLWERDNVSQLLYAIDGLRRSGFHNGREARSNGKKFLDIKYALGSRERVDRLGEEGGYEEGKQHPYLGDSEATP